jgi:hypothetical protein
MREITKEELEKILINHLHWIKEDCEGWEDMRADLSRTDLRRVNFYGANLSGAILYGANLYRANLYRADLYKANLSAANLSVANLSGANLRRANLYAANLSGTDLCKADLRGVDLDKANLYDANLYGANLSNANLCGTDLRGAAFYRANLSGAILREANLSRALLSEAENIPYIPMACPDNGAFIAWKKAHGYIVKLFIPSDARRSSGTGRKCRCDKATVIGIENLDGTTADITEVTSDYDLSFKYVLHGHVAVDNFCTDRWKECSNGIHFFVNREEAVNY